MTTQPQSPSEQEIEQQVDFALADMQETISRVLLKRRILALIAQAADKREQEVLVELKQDLETSGLTDMHLYSVIVKRLAQLRQGRAAEGEGAEHESV